MKQTKFTREQGCVLGFYAIIVICIFTNEIFLAFHFLIFAVAANFFFKAGWPGYVKGTSLLMLAAGIPIFLLHAAIGYFMHIEEVEHAMRGRDLIDSNRSKYEQSVEEFSNHLENGTVKVFVQDLVLEEGLGPISQKIKSYYYGWFTAFMPDNLGSEPVMALGSIMDASKHVVLMDIEASLELSIEKDRLISEELGTPVDELSIEDRISVEPLEIPGATHARFYSCLLDKDGNLLHLSSLEGKLLYLDLTEDPIFKEIGDVCEDVARSGESGRDYEAVLERARAAVGLPPIKYED